MCIKKPFFIPEKGLVTPVRLERTTNSLKGVLLFL
jgi:hypothetical protein